ncbi:hypothetical protein [Streptomyces sp. NPDC002851]
MRLRAADLDLRLRPDDEAAVAALLAAQRRQAIADVLRRQKTEALAEELTSPAAVLARWSERDDANWNQLPMAEHLQDIADAFAQHRPESERTPEHQLLEVTGGSWAPSPNCTRSGCSTRCWRRVCTAPTAPFTRPRHRSCSTDTPGWQQFQ